MKDWRETAKLDVMVSFEETQLPDEGRNEQWDSNS